MKQLVVTQDVYATELAFNNNAACEIKDDDTRLSKISGPNDTYTVTGSTFATTDPWILGRAKDSQGNAKPSHTLDACITEYTYSRDGKNSGVIVSLGDGCGGHFGDVNQDIAIANTAHDAVMFAAEELAKYNSENKLLENLQVVVDTVAQRVLQSKDKRYNEGATLVAGRSFSTENGYRFVGFNVGDSMIISWNPNTKTLRNLAPARVLNSGGGNATAQIPCPYQPKEICKVDVELEYGTVIIPLSDGIYDNLDCLRRTGRYEDDEEYVETKLDEAYVRTILQDIPADAPVKSYVDAITKHVIAHVEAERQEKSLQSKEAAQQLRELEAELEQKTQDFQTELEQIEAQHNIAALSAEDYKKSWQEINARKRNYFKSQEFSDKKSSIDDLFNKSNFRVGDDVTITGIRLPSSKEEALVLALLNSLDNPKQKQRILKNVVKNVKYETLSQVFSQHIVKNGFTVENKQQAIQEIQQAFLKQQNQTQKRQFFTVIMGAIFLTPLSLLFSIPLYKLARRKAYTPVREYVTSQDELRKIKELREGVCQDSKDKVSREENPLFNRLGEPRKIVTTVTGNAATAQNNPDENEPLLGTKMKITMSTQQSQRFMLFRTAVYNPELQADASAKQALASESAASKINVASM